MNVAVLSGTILDCPELRYSREGLACVSMRLGFEIVHGDGEEGYEIQLIAFGNLAVEAHKNFREGAGAVVEGRLLCETRGKYSAATREELGVKEKVIQLIANKFHPFNGMRALTGARKQKTAEAPMEYSEPKQRPAASEANDADGLSF
ncbi:single-stranded DNA-binding protein [Gloeobacter morelensis]|uniref:single-stranded DNA-binding protein n=1 Tax=Gloeobacter morelensis TaxID=2907343 RepID=UPI001E609092|nr:single-stranded DNA-binding protein [Gloeobacter morelensis]UFP97171.1 single-stranded DNA-binding protein [Gloeobacter morelensis MG652769]